MQTLHSILVYLHVVIGALAIVMFWLPVFSRKGSKLHSASGKLFVRCIWIICLTGVFASVIVWVDPLAIRAPDREFSTERAAKVIAHQRMISEFLLMLSFLVLACVKQAEAALRYRDNRDQLKTFTHMFWILGLVLLGMLVSIKGYFNNHTLLMIFGPIGFFGGVGRLRYIFKKNLKPREWIIEHFANMLGGGIGVYTAFFAFGGSRYLQEILPGMWQVLPWVLPAVIGVTATWIFTPIYRKRYRVVEAEEPKKSSPSDSPVNGVL